MAATAVASPKLSLPSFSSSSFTTAGGVLDLIAVVACEEEAKAGGTHGNRWIGDWNCADAALEESFG